jgi:BirA family transcriptional regulator, biotin operon repressor / biotin---[acetyl-CoA-carboxylase] ligase
VAHPIRSITLDEVGSTNTEAFERARAGEKGPLWVVARRQTKGRGRSGRSWTSERGNLYASLLQRLACPPAVMHQLSLVAGVAVADAIRAVAGPEQLPGLRLKWPNDVLIGDAKCAGILAESQIGGEGAEVIAVIGVGINLASHPTDLNRAATDLASHAVRPAPEDMLSFLAQSMEHWLAAWDRGKGFAGVRMAWLERGGKAGESLAVDTGKERIAGTFLDLDADGALLMRDARGVQRRVTFGDVTLAGGAPKERG